MVTSRHIHERLCTPLVDSPRLRRANPTEACEEYPPVRRSGDLVDIQCRRIRAQHSVGLANSVKLTEDLLLQLHVLENCLHNLKASARPDRINPGNDNTRTKANDKLMLSAIVRDKAVLFTLSPSFDSRDLNLQLALPGC